MSLYFGDGHLSPGRGSYPVDGMPSKKRVPSRRNTVDNQQAVSLHESIAVLMRRFRIEPGLLAGSVYADLHANDIGLFEVLAGSGDWNVQRLAQALSAPISTISSALDRLERQRLIRRSRIVDDRRVVRIALTPRGKRLAVRLVDAHIDNCRAMLAQLNSDEREQFCRLAAQIAGRSFTVPTPSAASTSLSSGKSSTLWPNA
jgi:DNA-binding MarR family transcriptional regulator